MTFAESCALEAHSYGPEAVQAFLATLKGKRIRPYPGVRNEYRNVRARRGCALAERVLNKGGVRFS